MRRQANKSDGKGVLVSLSTWGAIAAAFGFSLFYNQQYSQYLGLAGFCFLVYLAANAGRMARQNRPIMIAAPLVVSILFWLWWLIAAQLSPVAYVSQATVWSLLMLPAVAVASWWHSAVEADFFRRLPAVLAIGGCVLALLAIHQFFILQSQPQATFINRNNFSALEVMILVIVIGGGFAASLEQRKLFPPVLFYGVVALLVFVVGLAASRASLFVLFCSLVAVLTGGWLIRVERARIGWALLAIFIGLLMAAIANSGVLAPKLASLGSPFEVGSGGLRFSIWKASVEMVPGNLWTGIGPGLYWLLYPRYRSPNDSSGGYYAHNDYLQFLIEAGLPALILLLVLILFVSWKTFRLVSNRDVPQSTRMLALSLWLALASVSGHSLLSFNLYLLPILIVMGLVLGGLSYLVAGTRDTAVGSGRRNCVCLALLAVIMVFPATFYVKAVGGGFALSKAMAASELEQPNEREMFLESAITYWPQVDFYHYSLAWALFTRAEKEDGGFLSPEVTERIFSHLDVAHQLNPLRARSFLIEARVLEAISSQRIDIGESKVVSAYLEALERNPKLLEARFFYARFLLERNRLNEGVRVLEEGLKWPYQDSLLKMNYYRLTAEMRKIGGDMAGYTALMARVAQVAEVLRRSDAGKHAGRLLEF